MISLVIIFCPPRACILRGPVGSTSVNKALAVLSPEWVEINPPRMPPARDSVTHIRAYGTAVDKTQHPELLIPKDSHGD